MSGSGVLEQIDVAPYVNCAALVSDRTAYTISLLELLNDPDSERQEVSELISADPGLVSRLLVLANSAWIGARAESTNAWDATRVLGFTMVRNLAAANLVHLSSSNPHLPAGYLDHAIASAGGAAAVADRVGVKVRDALSVALLHDLGMVLLSSVHGHDAIAELRGQPIEAEVAEFGFDHAALGGAVLRQMRLPALVCDSVRDHVLGADQATNAMSLTVRAGIAMAESLGAQGCSAPLGDPQPFLRELDIDDERADIAADLETHAGRLTDLLK